MTQLPTTASLLPTFSTLNLDAGNILSRCVEKRYPAHIYSRIINRLTKPLSLLFLPFRTLQKKALHFHAGENKFSSGRKYFFIREKINFHEGESFAACGRKFCRVREKIFVLPYVFYSGLLTRCKTFLQYKIT